jgi:glutamate dehydrogenase/leucine dehydrogenase
MAQESLNPFEIAQRQFDIAAERLGLEDGMRQVLRSPKRQLIVSVPTLTDDGRPRAGSATTPSSPSTRLRRWPCG